MEGNGFYPFEKKVCFESGQELSNITFFPNQGMVIHLNKNDSYGQFNFVAIVTEHRKGSNKVPICHSFLTAYLAISSVAACLMS